LNAISETWDALLRFSLRDHFVGTLEFHRFNPTDLHLQMSADGFTYLTMSGQPNPIRVPDYRLLMCPVSFHHPLHWFYAQLLALVPRALRASSAETRRVILDQMFECVEPSSEDNRTLPELEGKVLSLAAMQDFFNVRDRMSLVFDHTIRTQVLVSQIRAGIIISLN
jgi:hypothetical protein